ncbi:MAG: PadR family transcriptional regulator [Microbacterium sp.]|uniref:PadR family transcriptional regulator n=1 Tax=Microbacterium sp. TaxID=51671 RepID=UPI0039E5B23E
MTDVSSRLTPLAVMALGVLREGAMHPYEMMRLMRQRRDDRLVAIAGGTFYNTISRLERWGLVEEVGVDRAGNRPERTTYAVTDAGIAAADDWIRRELPRIDRLAEFRVALSEAHDLSRDEASALLADRRRALQSELDDTRDSLEDAISRDVPLQYLIDGEREVALLEAEIAWHDAIIARFDDHTIPWGEHAAHSHDVSAHRKGPRT